MIKKIKFWWISLILSVFISVTILFFAPPIYSNFREWFLLTLWIWFGFGMINFLWRIGKILARIYTYK